MKNIDLKVTGNSSNLVFKIDGKEVKFKKNKYGNKVGDIDVDNDEVVLTIDSFNELESPIWAIMTTLFSLISIFGIFDVGYDNRPTEVHYVGTLKLDQDINDVQLAIKPYRSGSKVFESSGLIEVEDNETNIYKANLSIKRRLKIVKRVRLFMWLALIATIILLITLL